MVNILLTQSFTRFVSRNVKIHLHSDTRRFRSDSVSSVRSVGITAGASTPKKIIEEVHTRMAEQSFAELLKGRGKDRINQYVQER